VFNCLNISYTQSKIIQKENVCKCFEFLSLKYFNETEILTLELYSVHKNLHERQNFSLNQQTELNIVFFYSFNNKKGKKLKLTISNKKTTTA